MNFRSIRWRLPLSYAGIALLTMLALGTILIASIRGYYQRQERSYLEVNAEQFSLMMAHFLASDLAEVILQDQVNSWSFMAHVRVRVLDQDGNMLADSGIPDFQEVLMVSTAPLTVQDIMVEAAGEEAERAILAQPSAGIFILRSTDGITETVTALPAQEGEGGLVLRRPVTNTVEGPYAGPTTRAYPGASYEQRGDGGEDFLGVSISLAPTLYGFVFEADDNASVQRSRQQIEVPVNDRDGNLLGTILLSDGPAYGDEIVNNVWRGWLAAGLAAVLLAGSTGWWIGQRMTQPLQALTKATMRMAGGELSSRAQVESEDEFGALSHSFNDMADRVEEMVSTLGRFVADAAHELHTPLTALRTNLELAADEADAARRAGFLIAAQEQGNRLEAVVGGLLDLSRLEAQPVSHQTLDLKRLVQGLVEPYASRAEQLGVDFQLALPEGRLELRGDEKQLQRAIGNLLDNGLKFTPAGGRVTLEVERCDGWICLRVTDTGIGIPAEDMPRLFQRFHRGRNAAGYAGSGLGLAIVQTIVAAHQGEVYGEPSEEGARFVMRLPGTTISGGGH